MSTFTADIKDKILSLNDYDIKNAKDSLDDFGFSYDLFLSHLNKIELDYIINNFYNEKDLSFVCDKVIDYYIKKINNLIDNGSLDLRYKDIEIDKFIKEIDDIIKNNLEVEDYVQDKGKCK